MTIRFQYKRGGWFQFLAIMLGIVTALVVSIVCIAVGLSKHSTANTIFGLIVLGIAIWTAVGVWRAGKRDGVDYFRPWTR
jgi:threonine/homoserine/homoserine lactone efflux protein